MKASIKRALLLIAGWGFILIGIAGLVLPILQGVLFIFVGLAILSTQYAWARRLLARLRERYPKLHHVAEQAVAKAHRWKQRIVGRGRPRA